jgi:cysteine desulfurase
MRRVYLDYNASAPMPEPVHQALGSALARLGGNPSSAHAEGQAARLALDEAREEVARFTAARPSEVVFTSGGSESNNLAIRGIAAAAAARHGGPPRIITSAVEHPSVLETCRQMARGGAVVEVLPVDGEGLVDPGDLEARLRLGRVDLISLMHANNETGVIQPVEEFTALAERDGVPFHTDMAQSAGKISLENVADEVSAVTLASHKLGGPMGIGALVVREGVALTSLITGGAQEGRKRAGTEPAALAEGFAAALRLAAESEEAGARLRSLCERVEEALPAMDPGSRVHGAGARRIPNTICFHLPAAPGRYLVMQLDLMGFAVSTGSACSTGSARPSHVLEAMGRPADETGDSLRVSLGPGTTSDEIDEFIEALGRAVHRARSTGAPAAALLTDKAIP